MTEQALMPVDPAPAQATRAVAVVTPMDMLQVAMERGADLDKLRITAIRETYSYDPETGVVSWKRKTNRCVVIGSEAGFYWRSGRNVYRRLMLNGVGIFAHVVAFVLTHYRFPLGVIDHINGIGTDNRLSNLREVSHTDNLRNQRRSSANTSGHMGVDFHHASGQWRARIIVDQRERHLGIFNSYGEAVSARKAAETLYGFSANHGRVA